MEGDAARGEGYRFDDGGGAKDGIFTARRGSSNLSSLAKEEDAAPERGADPSSRYAIVKDGICTLITSRRQDP